jgi:hypothetical protein
MKPNWVCQSCGMWSSRKYSVQRHIDNKHYGYGRVIPYLEYFVGRQSGFYAPSSPPLNRSRKGLIHWIHFRRSIIESWPEEQLVRCFLLDILSKIICKKKFIEHSRDKLKHVYSHHNKRFASSNLPGLEV